MIDIGNEGVARIARGGEPWSLYMEKTFQRTDDPMLAAGALTKAEISERRHALEDSTCYYRDVLHDACWGRRPA
jgi:hypothetical protein